MNSKLFYTLTSIGLVLVGILSIISNQSMARSTPLRVEPVQACVMARYARGVPDFEQLASCLRWHEDSRVPICQGYYDFPVISPLSSADEVQLTADKASLHPQGRTTLQGHVEVRQASRIMNANTAYVYRDAKTNQVTRIELLGDVHFLEPDRLLIARKATLNPQDKSGLVEDAFYLFKAQRSHAMLPAWGRARFIQRFANQDYWLQRATYSTCPPTRRAWEIEAQDITLHKVQSKGVAKHATLKVGDWPVLYSPYLTFPISRERQSGFLMPTYGYSNVGGFDFALPYYLNLAPNYDATFVPHEYTRRGTMVGGEFRYLTPQSTGVVSGNVLPNDKAFHRFIMNNEALNPSLQGVSNDRWTVLLHNNTALFDNLKLHLNFQQVSDDYYLQDFSTNLAVSSVNQLLREGDLTFTTDHWVLRGMLQDYQTLHPINQSAVADTYDRLPQLMAHGIYNELPLHANFDLLGQFDYFRWPAKNVVMPQGQRYHVIPTVSLPQIKPWGYITPEVQLVDNQYQLQLIAPQSLTSVNHAIPRFSVDGGLVFEREESATQHPYTQTLEPRVYYLNVPYQNQSQVPAFDAAYMIFTTDQLFRNNRFSGVDRVGDANQFAYALTSRWLAGGDGAEKASVSVGQIRYFADRKVQLCYSPDGNCVDPSLFLGYLSPVATTSPIASRATFEVIPSWTISGDYVWDTFTRSTNNADINIHYQPEINHILSLGYGYIVEGNVLAVPDNALNKNALNQITGAYAWPLTEKWSSLGVYSYNISKSYSMLTFFGLQYDSCCWAARLMGGRTFKSLSPDSLTPEYNNNVYIQVLLKGLGSVGSSDPATSIRSYLPGYINIF